MDDLFQEMARIILLNDATEKCQAMHNLALIVKQQRSETQPFAQSSESHNSESHNSESHNLESHNLEIKQIDVPGYPEALKLVMPRDLKRRGLQSQAGRNILMHAVAHIEFNAINLALDAAYRFRGQPIQFYQDWIKIADDEARHFGLIRDYLNQNDCDYGDLPAHNGLWDMAIRTQHDIVARMALVPRVLEARGLDVTPGMIKRLKGVGDDKAVEILNTIYQDEIAHVETGSKWFFYHCKLRKLEPRSTFLEMVEIHLHGELRGPFNIAARLQAGFDEIEMAHLSERY